MSWLKKLLKLLLVLTVTGVVLGVLIVAGIYLHLKPELPSIENLKDVRLQVPLRVFSVDDKLIAEFGEKRRIPVTYESTPRVLTQAILAAEDDAFFSHPGIDPVGLARAAFKLAVTGKRRQGGSTITMQVARNFYLSRERTFIRKIREIFLALHIEKELSKEEILELYLNKIYLGHRSYGVGAAAQVYYGKSVEQLTLAESAMIAGLPKAPSTFNPVTNPARAVERRNYVLGRMKELNQITSEEYESALALPVSAKLHRANIELEAPYIAEMVRKYMVDNYGPAAYTGGYEVRTTVDSRLQTAANSALRKALESYDRRHGWRGPEAHFDELPQDDDGLDRILTGYSSVHKLVPALVVGLGEQTASLYLGQGDRLELPWDSLKWARKYITEDRRGNAPKTAAEILQPGDLVRVQQYVHRQKPSEKEGEVTEELRWRLTQEPDVAGALVSLDPDDGALLALVGGYDFYQSKFNRATQAKRQPGSGFKAFIYSAALEAGFTAASVINDAPVVFDDVSLEGAWRPENYSGKFFGPTRLRYALTKSRNLVSIRLLRSMGLKHALDHIENFGFARDRLPQNLSLALGSATVTPIEMARGYAVLANNGYLVEPYFIRQVEEAQAGVVFAANPLTVCENCPEPPPATEPCADCPATPGIVDAEAGETAADSEAEEQQPRTRHAPRVITPENRYLMYSMMQDVITRGTGRGASKLGRVDLAGKTGTSNDQRDAWFNGYNRSIVTNVWVGFDDNGRLGRGEVGGKAALPAWIDFMEVALQDIPDTPPTMPQGMVTVRIDPESGLRAPTGMKGTIFEVFRQENVPALAAQPEGALPQDSQTDDTGPKSRIEDLF